MRWRPLTEDEASTLPEARLGGALLAIAAAALLLFLVSLLGSALAFERLRELGPRYMIAVGFATLWSLAFLAMTAWRWPPTPTIASTGLVLWIVWRTGTVLSQSGLAQWPLLVDLTAEAALAAGFCGYMAAAVRPNAYYRRRLPVL